MIIHPYYTSQLHLYDYDCVFTVIQAVLLSIPSQDRDGEPVSVMELGPAACVCPRDPPNLSE